jgi:hypothetical protein
MPFAAHNLRINRTMQRGVGEIIFQRGNLPKLKQVSVNLRR